MNHSPKRPRTSHGRGQYGSSKLSARDYSSKVTDTLGSVGEPDTRGGPSHQAQRNHMDDINAIHSVSFNSTRKRKKSKRKLENAAGLEPLQVAQNRQQGSIFMRSSTARLPKDGSPTRSYFVENVESPECEGTPAQNTKDRRKGKKSRVGMKLALDQLKQTPLGANQTIDIHDTDDEKDLDIYSNGNASKLNRGEKKEDYRQKQNDRTEEDRDDSPNARCAKTAIANFFSKRLTVDRPPEFGIKQPQSTSSTKDDDTEEVETVWNVKKINSSRKSAKSSSRSSLSPSVATSNLFDSDDENLDRKQSLTSTEQATHSSQETTTTPSSSTTPSSRTMTSSVAINQDSSHTQSTPSSSRFGNPIELDMDNGTSCKTPLSGQKEVDTVNAIEKEVISFSGMKRSAQDPHEKEILITQPIAKKPRSSDEQQKSPMRRFIDGTVGTVQSVFSNVASGLKLSRQKESPLSSLGSNKRALGKRKGTRIQPGKSLSKVQTEINENTFTFLSKPSPQENRSRAMVLRVDDGKNAVMPSTKVASMKLGKNLTYPSRKSERLSGRRTPRNAGQAIEILSDSDGEMDSSNGENTDSISLHVARIAIGKKVFSEGCKVKLSLKGNASILTLSFRRRILASQSDSNHALDLNQLQEVKYFSISKLPPEEQTSCNMQRSLLVMRIGKTVENGLQNHNNAYQPEGNSIDKRYLVVEFASDDEFLAFISLMEKSPVASAFLADAQLRSTDVSKYCTSLSPIRKRRTRSDTTEDRPEFLRGRADDDIILVYPFDGAVADIEAAANGLKEAGEGRLNASDATEMPNVSDPNSDDEGDKAEIRKHYVTVHVQDYLRLRPGEFLNDSLIDFWMQWISRNDRSQIHIFTSHFYSTLKEKGVSAVASWTKNRGINIFEKKLIFIPVNKNLHWSLCVLVNAGAIESHLHCDDVEYEDCDDKPVPSMLFFDSLNMHEKHKVAENLRKWLNTEWSRLKNSDSKPFNRNTMKVESPKVPTQDNFYDCGVFVCRYAYAMYHLRHKTFSYKETNHHRARQSAAYKELITESPLFQFSCDDIDRMREEMKMLIERLTKPYSKWRLEEEAKRRAKKRKTACQVETNDGQDTTCEKHADHHSMTTQPGHSQESSDVVEVLSPPLAENFESDSPSSHLPSSTETTELLSQQSQSSISEPGDLRGSRKIGNQSGTSSPTTNPLDAAERTKVADAISPERPHVESMYRPKSGRGYGPHSFDTGRKVSGSRVLHAEI